MHPVILDTLQLILSSSDFLGALPLAGIILGVGTGLLVIRRRFPAVPVAGIAFAAAAMYGLSETPVASDPLVTAIAAFAVAGLVRDVIEIPPYAQVLLALPGAWLIAGALPFAGPGWVLPVCFVFLAVGAPLLAGFDRSQTRPPLGPLVLAISVGAAYLTLPDTEEILVLVPIAAAIALCAWPLGTMRLGAAGSHAALAVVAAVASWDGRGRPAAIIGVMATFAVPYVWGALVAWGDRVQPVTTTSRVLTLGTVHLVVAIVAARVVGIGSSVTTATVLGSVTLVVTVVGLTALGLAWSKPTES
ncbi:MAG: hypothetical protein WD990_09585 [Acidimicrobiia bacterium]